MTKRTFTGSRPRVSGGNEVLFELTGVVLVLVLVLLPEALSTQQQMFLLCLLDP